MSDSNRGDSSKPDIGYWIFIVGVIAVGFLAIVSIAQLVDRGDATRNAANYAANANNQITAECVIASDYAKCAREIEEAARSGERGEYDLYSQQTMALWTTVMGAMAVIGVAMSGVGVYLIWYTWDATREAARISRQTYEAFISLERPVLVPKVTLEHKEGEHTFGIKLDATNIGKALCIVEKIYVAWADKPKIPLRPGSAPWEAHKLVEPGKTESIYDSWSDTRGLKDARFYSGIIVYRSPLNKAHKAHFCVECALITIKSTTTSSEMIRLFDRLDLTQAADT